MEKELAKRVSQENVKQIKLLFSDVLGNEKTLTISTNKVEDLMNNKIWVDASDIEGLLHICEDEMYLSPKIETYKIVKDVDGNINAYIICDVFSSDGEKYEVSKSMITKSVINDARKIGYNEMSEEELVRFLFTNVNQDSLARKSYM